jgi:hypothetical protein
MKVIHNAEHNSEYDTEFQYFLQFSVYRYVTNYYYSNKHTEIVHWDMI